MENFYFYVHVLIVGRAETWDNDNQGISKGEHNHPAEHEIAELEYFKVLFHQFLQLQIFYVVFELLCIRKPNVVVNISFYVFISSWTTVTTYF